MGKARTGPALPDLLEHIKPGTWARSRSGSGEALAFLKESSWPGGGARLTRTLSV